MERLQKRIEETKNKIKSVQENNQDRLFLAITNCLGKKE